MLDPAHTTHPPISQKPSIVHTIEIDDELLASPHPVPNLPLILRSFELPSSPPNLENPTYIHDIYDHNLPDVAIPPRPSPSPFQPTIPTKIHPKPTQNTPIAISDEEDPQTLALLMKSQLFRSARGIDDDPYTFSESGDISGHYSCCWEGYDVTQQSKCNHIMLSLMILASLAFAVTFFAHHLDDFHRINRIPTENEEFYEPIVGDNNDNDINEIDGILDNSLINTSFPIPDINIISDNSNNDTNTNHGTKSIGAPIKTLMNQITRATLVSEYKTQHDPS